MSYFHLTKDEAERAQRALDAMKHAWEKPRFKMERGLWTCEGRGFKSRAQTIGDCYGLWLVAQQPKQFFANLPK